MNAVLQITKNTFVEAIRQKFFYFLIIFAFGMLLSADLLKEMNFGQSELKFIFDFGYGAIFFFGSILSIVAMCQLFFSEMDNRTALTLLAKPVRRSQFLLGKYLGVVLLQIIFVALLSVVLGWILYARESALMELRPDQFEAGRVIDYGGLLGFTALQALRLLILVAMTLFIAAFSSSQLFAVIVSFMAMLICQIQYLAQQSYAALDATIWSHLLWAVSRLFPNFQLFNVGEHLVLQTNIDGVAVAYESILIYGAAYILVYLFLAVVVFNKREV